MTTLEQKYKKLQQLKELKKEHKLRMARKDFWEYCKVKAPDFYKEDRAFLKDMANQLQWFIESSDEDCLVVNLPPRHGKSRTGGNLVEWILGENNTFKIMTGSYNETLSTTFARGVRNTIQEEKADENRIVYSDIFPNTKIKYGEGAMNLWSLEGGYNNYLATSPGGTATGFGADLILIDDLIKNAYEANTAHVLEEHWEWFTNTMLSRLETGGKIIIIMTRWSSKDLAGKALEELPKLGYTVKHINYKAMQEDGTMLCDELLSKEEYDRRRKAMSPEVASANYQQEPIDLKGRLYDKDFKTYSTWPQIDSVWAYTDTADTGNDYLATYIFGVKNKEAYIKDVVYTQAGMEETEILVANALIDNEVHWAVFESNNGGRGFARAVERRMLDLGWNNTRVEWFHQSKNKKARILTQSVWVMDHIYWPENYRIRWPELSEDLFAYQREGRNKHDDAPDALTGVAELVQDKLSTQGSSNSNYMALMAGLGRR